MKATGVSRSVISAISGCDRFAVAQYTRANPRITGGSTSRRFQIGIVMVLFVGGAASRCPSMRLQYDNRVTARA